MNRPFPIAPILGFAFFLCACGTDTRLQRGVLDAGRDARVDDAASPDGSQAQSDSSAGHDADVAKEPCDAACKGATPHCDIATDTCVACTGDQHCEGDPNNSRCVQGACVPCETNEHCQGITNGSVALGVCDQGACVECTGHDYAACGKNDKSIARVCDSVNKSCSTQLTGSQDLCQACVSDAACKPGRRCVAQKFGETEIGSFCLWERGSGQDDAPNSCSDARPFVQQLNTKSVDGHTATFCSLRSTITCPAYKDFGEARGACGRDTQDNKACGVSDLNDGLCRLLEAGSEGPPATPDIYNCTTPCSSHNDCKGAFSCIPEGADGYCSLQTGP